MNIERTDAEVFAIYNARASSALSEREVSICDPKVWLSELLKYSEYIKLSTNDLETVIA